MSVSIGELTNQLQVSSIEARIDAAQQLAALGDDAAPAALALLAASESADESLCEWATVALENCGAPHPSDLSQLLEYLHVNSGASHHVRYWATTLIGRMKREASSASGQLSHYAEYVAEKLEAEKPGADHPKDPVADNFSSYQSQLTRTVWALGQVGERDSQAEEVLLALKRRFPQYELQIDCALEELD